MVNGGVRATRLQEDLVKEALAEVDWPKLEAHLDSIGLSEGTLEELCGHIRRYSNWIAKYPRKDFEKRRQKFLSKLAAYATRHLNARAAEKVTAVLAVVKLIEHGYRSILDVLDKCAIGKLPAAVRVSACISRACYEYQDLLRRRDKALKKAKEVNVMAGIEFRDDDGNVIAPDAVIEGLAASVAMTLIMEAYKNDWFVDDVVVLPTLPSVGEQQRFQSGANQVLALFWRHWQRLEKRRRFLGGEIRTISGYQKPPGTPAQAEAVIRYFPPESGMSEREVYDYLANARLKDRLIQTFMEMEVELRITDQSIGIEAPAKLPPDDLVSAEEGHAGVSLSEILGYSIVDDTERPGGLRLLEWVRGYAVLKELGQARARDQKSSGSDLTVVFSEAELLDILERCGLEKAVAAQFVRRASLHKSSRDMFDCPLVRQQDGNILLFAPAVIDVNIPLAVLSNLSNRGEELGRKGKAFEAHIREILRRNNIEVYAFKVTRDGQEFEYDAVAVWDNYIFVFECKNRSLSGTDPAQTFYFDLEVHGQAKQAMRLANALAQYPDIVEKKIGVRHLGKTVIPCVLHSLPYSRIAPLDGVYFTDASALTRFLEQKYFRVKVPHRIRKRDPSASHGSKGVLGGRKANRR